MEAIKGIYSRATDFDLKSFGLNSDSKFTSYVNLCELFNLSLHFFNILQNCKSAYSLDLLMLWK